MRIVDEFTHTTEHNQGTTEHNQGTTNPIYDETNSSRRCLFNRTLQVSGLNVPTGQEFYYWYDE